MENTSGHGKFSNTPDAIDKWNWGAFWLTWIWGIGNKTYIALLALIPILNIIMPFYLGKNGNKLAWQNQYWYNERILLNAQKKWAIAGWVTLCILLILGGFEVVEMHRYNKDIQRVRNALTTKIDEDEGALNFIGGDYSIDQDTGFSISEFGGREQYMPYVLVLKSGYELFWVRVDFDEGNQIRLIELTRFADDEKYVIE